MGVLVFFLTRETSGGWFLCCVAIVFWLMDASVKRGHCVYRHSIGIPEMDLTNVYSRASARNNMKSMCAHDTHTDWAVVHTTHSPMVWLWRRQAKEASLVNNSNIWSIFFVFTPPCGHLSILHPFFAQTYQKSCLRRR